jgi:hypothetical protein
MSGLRHRMQAGSAAGMRRAADRTPRQNVPLRRFRNPDTSAPGICLMPSLCPCQAIIAVKKGIIVRNIISGLLLLVLCGVMVSGCVIDPWWHHHGEHHDRD